MIPDPDLFETTDARAELTARRSRARRRAVLAAPLLLSAAIGFLYALVEEDVLRDALASVLRSIRGDTDSGQVATIAGPTLTAAGDAGAQATSERPEASTRSNGNSAETGSIASLGSNTSGSGRSGQVSAEPGPGPGVDPGPEPDLDLADIVDVLLPDDVPFDPSPVQDVVDVAATTVSDLVDGLPVDVPGTLEGGTEGATGLADSVLPGGDEAGVGGIVDPGGFAGAPDGGDVPGGFLDPGGLTGGLPDPSDLTGGLPDPGDVTGGLGQALP